MAPALQWLLAHSVRRWAGPAAADTLLAAFSLAYNALWLLPAYAVSLVVNGMWWVAGQQERAEVFQNTKSSWRGRRSDESGMLDYKTAHTGLCISH